MRQKIRVIFIAGVASVALAACAGQELERAEHTKATGSAFDKALYAGYIGLSRGEYGEGDYADSDVFAMRAKSAAAGAALAPESISQRKLPADKVGDLTSARKRLVGAMNSGAHRKAPKLTARAQVMFDCWMQEQEENFQPKDIQRCRGGFASAMAAVNAAMTPPVKAAARAKPVPATRKFVVYFPFGKSGLTEDSRRTILQALEAAKKIGAKRVFIGGHTDRAGAQKFNDKLSERRAAEVARAIERGGVSTKLMSLGFFGESIPAVSTKDGIAKQENRRVEIEVRN